jgi:hypothetical protein
MWPICVSPEFVHVHRNAGFQTSVLGWRMHDSSRRTFGSLLAAHICLLNDGFFATGPGEYTNIHGTRIGLRASRSGNVASFELTRAGLEKISEVVPPRKSGDRQIALYRKSAALQSRTGDSRAAHTQRPTEFLAAEPLARLGPEVKGRFEDQVLRPRVGTPPPVLVSVVNVQTTVLPTGRHEGQDTALTPLFLVAVAIGVAAVEVIRAIALG